jgi:hypothetical protein
VCSQTIRSSETAGGSVHGAEVVGIKGGCVDPKRRKRTDWDEVASSRCCFIHCEKLLIVLTSERNVVRENALDGINDSFAFLLPALLLFFPYEQGS